MQKFVCSISRKDLQGLSDLAMQVYRNPGELPFTYFRPIRDRLYSWGFDAIKDAQAVMYLGRGDYDSYQIARNDLEDSGWLSPEIEINSLDKIPLGEYLQETRQSFRLFQSCLQFDGEVRGNGRGDGIPSPKFGTVV